MIMSSRKHVPPEEGEKWIDTHTRARSASEREVELVAGETTRGTVQRGSDLVVALFIIINNININKMKTSAKTLSACGWMRRTRTYAGEPADAGVGEDDREAGRRDGVGVGRDRARARDAPVQSAIGMG